MGITKFEGPDHDLVHPLDNTTAVGLNGKKKPLPPHEIAVDPRVMGRLVSSDNGYTTDFDAVDAEIDAATTQANGTERSQEMNGATNAAVATLVLDEHDAFVASLNGRKGNLPSTRRIIQTVDTPDAVILRRKRLQELRTQDARVDGAAKRRIRRSEGGLGRRLDGVDAAYVPASTPDDLTAHYADWIKQATREAAQQQRDEDKGWKDYAAQIEKRVAADAKLDEQYAMQDELEAGDAKTRTQRSLPRQADLADYIEADRARRSSHQHGKQDRFEARVQRAQKQGGVRGTLANEAMQPMSKDEARKTMDAIVDASILEALDHDEQQERVSLTEQFSSMHDAIVAEQEAALQQRLAQYSSKESDAETAEEATA